MPTYIREAELTYRRRKTPHVLGEPAFTTVRSSADVAPVARALIGTRVTESFIVLALSCKHKVIGFHEVARGSVSACPVVLGDVFRYPLIAGAAAIIVAHYVPRTIMRVLLPLPLCGQCASCPPRCWPPTADAAT